MDTKYRVTDLRDLQTKMMQDFLSMEVETEYPDDSWRGPFYDQVRKGIDGKYATSYEGAWKKIQEKGLDDFSFNDLDITAMTTCLKHLHCFDKCEFKRMGQVINRIQDNRNFESHMSSNETTEELYAWISSTIYNLKELVYAVGKNSHAEASVKDSFVQKYLHKINDIDILAKADLESYYGHKRVLKQIHRIKNGKNPQLEYAETSMQLLKTTGQTGDWSDLAEFTIAAAEEEIEAAYSSAAEFYFSGRGIEKDYLKAEYYCKKALEGKDVGSSVIPTVALLATIYINGLSNSESPECGRELLNKYEDNFDFQEIEEDGLIIIHPYSKK